MLENTSKKILSIRGCGSITQDILINTSVICKPQLQIFGGQFKITHEKLKPEMNGYNKSSLGYFSNPSVPQTQSETFQTHIFEAIKYFLHFRNAKYVT